MNLNFKYAMMSCAMLALGFASCSENDFEGDANLPVEGAKTFVTIELNSGTPSTRVELPGTAAEREIKTAVVYVFNGNKVLEEIVDFGASTTKTFESTIGLHYFLAAANLPTGKDINVPLGSGMEEVETVLNGITKDVFEGFTTDGNFFMTSGVVTGNNGYRAINSTSRTLVAATDTEAPTLNPVKIEIGRAMAKLNMTVNPSVVTYETVTTPTTKVTYNTAGGTFDASTAEFVVANNPSSMYFFPHFNTQLFQTPFFTDFDNVTAPQDFWPALHTLTDANYARTWSGSGAITSYAYIMENGNATPTYGNSTIVSLKVKFTPTATLVDGGAVTGTFYRVWDNAINAYTTQIIDGVTLPRFYKNLPTGLTATQESVEYKDGYCYYIIPVADESTSATARYNIYRNHFYNVGVRKVYACGHATPGGTPGTEPTDPLDPEDVYVAVTIDVLDWEQINQNVDLD